MFSIKAEPIYIPPTVHKSSLFSTPSPMLINTYLFDYSHSKESEVIVVFMCVFLMTSDVEQLFMYLLAFWMSSFHTTAEKIQDELGTSCSDTN